MAEKTLYKTIVIDPAWPMNGGGRIKRGADRHYETLKMQDIVGVIYESGVFTPDRRGCHVYLWTPNNFIPNGIATLNALGFRYVANIVWVKDRMGLGQYFRGQHEIALFGVRGRAMMPEARNVPSIIHAARRKHSEKPDEFFAAIERVSPGPRLEMFACVPRDGWITWGPRSHRDEREDNSCPKTKTEMQDPHVDNAICKEAACHAS